MKLTPQRQRKQGKPYHLRSARMRSHKIDSVLASYRPCDANALAPLLKIWQKSGMCYRCPLRESFGTELSLGGLREFDSGAVPGSVVENDTETGQARPSQNLCRLSQLPVPMSSSRTCRWNVPENGGLRRSKRKQGGIFFYPLSSTRCIACSVALCSVTENLRARRSRPVNNASP